MTQQNVKNTAASVRARLRQKREQTGEDFQTLLTRFGSERLLYRISQSKHSQDFILKGAAIFLVWTGLPHRPTRDVDLLGSGSKSIKDIQTKFREIISANVEPDGLIFDINSVQAERIKEDADYEGVRVKLIAKLESAIIRLQVDVGFGDAITPSPDQITYPVLLDFNPPILRAYNRETVVAEKFQAMVTLGIANSRMKDFFDIWLLARDFPFHSDPLKNAIKATFKRRKTKIPATPPLAFTKVFIDDSSKQQQWRAFVKRSRLPTEHMDLNAVINEIAEFILPVILTFKTSRRWNPGGPWKAV